MFPIPHPAFAKTYGLEALPHAQMTEPVELRLASEADAGALIRLAHLGSALAAAAELPGRARGGDVLIAEADGEVVAALSLHDGLLVTDPFHRTRAVVALLHERRRQIKRAERRSLLRVLRPRHV
jgi:hypothetical protein